MPFLTIQRADIIVAVLLPPAVIAAWLDDKLTNLLITAVAVAALRAILLRSVVAAYKAGSARGKSGPPHLAAVHDLPRRPHDGKPVPRSGSLSP